MGLRDGNEVVTSLYKAETIALQASIRRRPRRDCGGNEGNGGNMGNMDGARNTVVEFASFQNRRGAEATGHPPDGAQEGKDAPTPRAPSPLSLRLRSWKDGTQAFPVVVAIGAVLFGLIIPQARDAAMPASAAVGALFVLDRRNKLALVTAVLAAHLLLSGSARIVTECWLLLALAIAALVVPKRALSSLLRVSRWIWVLALALVIVCRAAAFVLPPPSMMLFSIASMPFAAYLGCGLARHLAMGDARLLSWGEDGLVPVTRDLLLGRIASGMLHDLAQPLNVISMANGNLGYIVEQLDIDPRSKADLTDRIARIATHTEAAAFILGLFRGFGRDGNRELSTLNVRGALERAIAATKSNVRYHGVSVELAGDGLDHLVPEQHGALEMMAVAALLNAFAGFIRSDGEKTRGHVRLEARLGPALVSIFVQCHDDAGAPVNGPMLDHATHWLVEQVALAASGDFRCYHNNAAGTRFLIRLGRDDI